MKTEMKTNREMLEAKIKAEMKTIWEKMGSHHKKLSAIKSQSSKDGRRSGQKGGDKSRRNRGQSLMKKQQLKLSQHRNRPSSTRTH
jgi:hypothetical protein